MYYYFINICMCLNICMFEMIWKLLYCLLVFIYIYEIKLILFYSVYKLYFIIVLIFKLMLNKICEVIL